MCLCEIVLYDIDDDDDDHVLCENVSELIT